MHVDVLLLHELLLYPYSNNYTVASVPTPSFPPQEDDPVLLLWHWVLIAVSIAIVLIVATVIGIILIAYAYRKSNAPNGPNGKAEKDIPM